jgi:tetratricopeptide (TPR) repeat protein
MPVTENAATPDNAPRAPYPGLRAFRREETDLFFGREGCINAMVDRLAATRFLAVLGSSGTGKSSLVRTGLLDALELGLMAQAGSRWRIADFRPGGSPMRNLARRLLETADASGETQPADTDVDLLRAFLLRGPRSAIEWCRSGHLEKGTNLLLLVDQFEELFRYQDYAGREEAEAFVALLLESARTREFPIYVAITMRSEYLGACALIDGLADAINAGMYLTPRMTRELCREAIVGPAAVCDIDIEPALVNRLLNDLANFAPWDEGDAHDQLDRLMRRADQLPLLQYTLNRMWLRARAGGGHERIKLTVADYEAIGGLSGALNAHANQIFEELGKVRWPVVESVFRTLTAGSSIADAVRRPTRFAELVASSGGIEAAVRAVVDAFRAPGVNFLVPEFDQDHSRLANDAYVDISHESLIRQWKRLGEWLEKEGRAAQQWRRLIDRHGTGEPLRGRELANLLAWRTDTKPNAAWASRYGGDYGAVTAFLNHSARVQTHKRFLIGGGAAAIFLTISASAVVAFHYARIAGDRLAENNRMLARAEEEGERAKLANDALVSLFENMSTNADQRSKSGAAITIDESLSAIRQFVARRPDDPELRRFLAINLNVYGDIRLQSNDLDNARKAFEESLEIGRALVVRDAARFQWQEVLAAALARVAQIKAKTNALAEARGQFEEAIALLRKLIERNVAEQVLNNIQSEKLLTSFQLQLGQLGDLLNRLSDTAAAITVNRERVGVYRRLLELAPDEVSRSESLSSGLDALGNLLSTKRNWRLTSDSASATRTAGPRAATTPTAWPRSPTSLVARATQGPRGRSWSAPSTSTASCSSISRAKRRSSTATRSGSANTATSW